MTRPNTLRGIPESLPPFTKTQSPKSFLYTRILKNYLGEQAAYVYALLSTNERLTFIRLLQLSSLKPAFLRKILVTLIQMNCVVYYHKPGVEDRTKVGTYYYYPHEEGCMKLIYADDIIRRIRSDYIDELFATIVQNVLSVGHLTVNAFLKPITDKNRRLEVEKAFKILVDDGWLIPVDSSTFLNQFDLFSKTFKSVTSRFNRENPQSRAVSQTKRMQMIKDLTYEKFLDIMENEEQRSSLRTGGSHTFRVMDDSSTQSAGMIDQTVPLTFYFERYLKRLRSIHLASEAKHRVGDISAKIYALALDHVEAKSRDVRSKEAVLHRLLANVGQSRVGFDPHRDIELKNKLALDDQSTGLCFSVPDIYRTLCNKGARFGLDKNDIYGTIDDPSHVHSSIKRQIHEHNDSTKKIKMVNGKLNMGDDDNDGGIPESPDPELMTLLLQHLKLLSSDIQLPFLRETTPGTFYIPFTELVPEITKHFFKQYVRQILGSPCLRVLNFIEKEHLTDVKALAKGVLMRDGDIRREIDRMQKFRLVEIQEIPKTQDRSAMRAAFAFRVNYSNAREHMKECLIFNMGEAFDSLDDIRADNKLLLDKVSRADVKGREQELLLPSELKQLRQCYDSQNHTLAKFFRLRSAVDVFEFMSGI